MAYHELMKDFSRIRAYMREFFVYGFKSREEISIKSARSYDNERRRMESWLAGYMDFHQDANGKCVFISVDSRRVPHNPLYQAWKAKSFTKNDVTLHFWLLDLLEPDKMLKLTEILERMDTDYLSYFPDAEPMDESTLRKKLKEYVDEGLICAQKQGKQLVYFLPEETVDLASWQEAVCFFSEINPLGVIGSFLQDKYSTPPAYFAFKHHYLLFAPDSGIVMELLMAIREHRRIELRLYPDKRQTVLPLQLFISTQNGRQYVACYRVQKKGFVFVRLDAIISMKLLDAVEEHENIWKQFQVYRQHLWGVSTGKGKLDHLEMILTIHPQEQYLVGRLEREKRCGMVEQLDETHWRFSADVYDALEMLPWIRTFIGRITALHCSDPFVVKRFYQDLSAMAACYALENGGENHVVQ